MIQKNYTRAVSVLRPHLELFSPLPPQQDQNLQHQRQVCPAVWLRNMESYQVKHPQAADLYQKMPRKHQNQMARHHFQQRPLGQDWSKPHWSGDQKKEFWVDRLHTQEVPLKRHQASPCLESTRKAQEYWRRGEGHRNDMGTAEEDLKEPSALEECCCCPMFLKKLKA